MNVKGILSEARQALNFNRSRSLLTTLSLAWGVGCFVILYSYGDGFGVALKTSMAAVGQDLVLMFGGQTSAQAGGERSGRKIRLEYSDVDAIRDAVPLVGAISPEVMLQGAAVLRGYRQQSMTVRGVETAYGKVRNMTLSSGRWLSGQDDQEKQRVAVLIWSDLSSHG